MLKESIRFLLKDSFYYGIAGAIAKFLAIFSIPLLARTLTKNDLGVYDVVLSISSGLVAFVVLGQDSAIARYYYESPDELYRKKVVSIGLYIRIGLILFFSFAFLICGDFIGLKIFNNERQYISYWKISLLYIPGQALLLFSQNIFKYTFERVAYLVLTLGSSLLHLSLLFIFVGYLDFGIAGALIPYVLSVSVFGLLGIWMNRKYLTIRFNSGDKQIFFDLFRYGLPFAGVMAIAVFLPSIDRLLLIRYTDNSVIAEYSIAVKISSILSLAISAFSIASGPYIFSVWHKREAPEVFTKLLHLYLGVVCYLIVLILVFRHPIIYIVGSDMYMNSAQYLPFLLASSLLEGVFIFSLIGIYWSKKAFYNLFIYLIGIVALLSLNFILIPSFLVYGAVWSLVVSKLLMNVVGFWISKRFYKIKLVPEYILKCSLLTITLILLVYSSFWGGVISLFVYPVLFYWFVMTREDKRSVTNYLKTLSSRRLNF